MYEGEKIVINHQSIKKTLQRYRKDKSGLVYFLLTGYIRVNIVTY